MADEAPVEGAALDVTWYADLEPDLQAVVAAKNWKGKADAVRSYANLEKAFGSDKIALPGKDAKPADWDAVYAKLGRPEAADKYDLGDFKAPDGLPWNPEGQAKMLASMHKAGLSSAQARSLLSEYATMQAESFQGMNGTIAASVEAAKAALQKEWGSAHGAKLDLANRAFKHAFGDGLEAARQLKTADGTFLFDNPALVKAFAKIGETMGEESLKGSAAQRLAHTPEEAKAEHDRMMGDPTIVAKMMNKSHPEYAGLQAKRNTLFNAMHPV